MRVTTSTLSLTVADVDASRDFFCTHLGYQVAMAADGFVSLTREDAAADLVLLRRGTEVLPPEQRDQQAAGLIFALTVTGIEAEERRLREAGAPVTMALREEPWGERLFQLTDPNGIVVQFVEWATPDGPVRTGEPAEPVLSVITPTEENVTDSPNARMTGLAAPSRGSAELSTWTVAMAAGQTGPEHAISREQVWTVTAGVLEVTCGARTEKIEAGRTFVLPADVLRRIHAPEAAEAHVAMRSDGVASAPGFEGSRALAWAQ